MDAASTHNILIKNAAKVRIIEETVRAYETLYPQRYAWMLREIKKLRDASNACYTDAKGRITHVKMKVPCDIFLFLQHVIPDFGKDSDDIELLTKTIKLLDAHQPMRSGQRALVVPHDFIFTKDAANVQEFASRETEDAQGDPEGAEAEGEGAEGDPNPGRPTGSPEGETYPSAGNPG